MTTENDRFSSYMFRLARTFRSLTQAELSTASSIAQAKLSRFEHGQGAPDENEIQRIAQVLSFPVSFFYQNTDADYPTGLIFHRKRSKLALKTRLKVESGSKIFLESLKKLLSELELETNVRKMPIEEYKDPVKIAMMLRYYWKIPSGPIQNLTKVLEDKGIIVLKMNMDTELLDGFFTEHNIPCIIINSTMSADRQRFTLAHELGHLIMHSIPSSTTENEANRFAAEFLAPADDIKEYFMRKKIDFELFAQLKPIWRISMAALIYRAEDLKFIADSTKRRFFTEMGIRGFRKTEPIPISGEKPTLLTEIITTYKKEFDYSDIEMAELLSLDISDYFQFFGVQKIVPIFQRPAIIR